MKKIVEKAIPNSSITSQSVFIWLRDIIIPVLRECRSIINGRFGAVVEVTSDYTVGQYEEIVLVDTTAGNIEIYLPETTGYIKTLVIKCTAANDVTINSNPAETATIDGGATYPITVTMDSVRLVSYKGNWYSV